MSQSCPKYTYTTYTTRHILQCFFKLFGSTLGLRKTEIEVGPNFMFFSLEEQLLLLHMFVSNIFSPITHADRKVKVMIIRKVTLDYSNREDFEGWLCDDEDFDHYCFHMLNRETSLF